MNIHPTAVVDASAQLGRDVTIGPFAYIEKEVSVGDGTVIGPHVSILNYSTIGAGCRVHANAVIGDLPQDLAFTDARSYARIGARCVIREGVTIHRGTKAESVTEIGDGCFLMANSHFAHNVTLGKSVIVANGALLGGYVEVGDRAFVSGNCAIHQFCRVGRLAMLGGLCVLTKDVPPFFMTRTGAYNRIAGCNVVGMRRAGIDATGRRDIKKSFAVLYKSGLNVTQAVGELRKSFTAGPAIEICDFIEASRRGICACGMAEDDEAD